MWDYKRNLKLLPSCSLLSKFHAKHIQSIHIIAVLLPIKLYNYTAVFQQRSHVFVLFYLPSPVHDLVVSVVFPASVKCPLLLLNALVCLLAHWCTDWSCSRSLIDWDCSTVPLQEVQAFPWVFHYLPEPHITLLQELYSFFSFIQNVGWTWLLHFVFDLFNKVNNSLVFLTIASEKEIKCSSMEERSCERFSLFPFLLHTNTNSAVSLFPV